MIQIYLDDPASSNRIKEVEKPPQVSSLPYYVDGFGDGIFPIGSPPWRSAQCYALAGMAIQEFASFRDRPTKWMGTPALVVTPDAGEGANAFYNRKYLKFYHVDGIYLSESPEVFLHELGHALLDAARPDILNSMLFETWSLHEAFADLHSLLNGLKHREFREEILKQCPNLDASNPASKMGEGFGKYLGADCVRDLWNNFSYTNPSSLPKKGERSELLQEPHSFSRIFSGAVYRSLVGIFSELKKDRDPVDALGEARDTVHRYLVEASGLAAVRPSFFDSFARAFLYCDIRAGSRWFQLIAPYFHERKIIIPQFSAQSSAKPGYKVVEGRGELVISRKVMRSQSENPLYDLRIDVANDVLKDADGWHGNSEEDVIESATILLDLLYRDDLVGDGKPFSIADGKLIRNHIS